MNSPRTSRATNCRHIILFSLESFRGSMIRDRALAIPNLRRWTSEGFHFSGCRTPAVVTAAAQAALLTGRIPAHNGVRFHFPNEVRDPTLFSILKRSGYHTIARSGFYNDLHSAGLLGDVDCNASTDREAWNSFRRARERGGRAFLFFQSGGVHGTAAARGKITGPAGALAGKLHGERLERFDRTRLASWLQWMENLRVERDTFVFLVGAHGEGRISLRRFGHGEVVQEDQLDVPWILRGPVREIRAGSTRTPVSLVDVAPTVLGLLGLPADSLSFDGNDHSPFLRKQRSRVRASACYAESWRYRPKYLKVLSAIAMARRGSKWQGRWSCLSKHVQLNQRTVRSGVLKLVVSGRDSLELFDLRADPGESRNLLEGRPTEEHRRTARKLLEKLRAIEDSGAATGARKPVGERVARFPLHFQVEFFPERGGKCRQR